jgi:hypothetical protein
MENPLRFTHRQNSEGSWDSICMTCFGTAAHGRSEIDLLRSELVHICIEINRYKSEAESIPHSSDWVNR